MLTLTDDQWNRIRALQVAAVALLLGTACADSGSSDSAGDRFAPNRITEPVGAEQRLSLVEELRIGSVTGDDGAVVFDRVTDLEVGSGGEIYALDGDYVRVFSRRGQSLHSWGGLGDGPGEFRGTFDLAPGRDTVAVAGRDRVHFFDRGGRFLNSVWPGGGLDAGYQAFGIHSTDSGWVAEILPRVVRVDPSPPPPRLRELRHLNPEDGSLGEPIVTYRRQPDVVQLASGRRISRAFDRIVDHGVDRQGGVYLPSGTGYELSVQGPDGAKSRALSMEVEPVPVTDAMLEEVRRELVARCNHAGWRRRCAREPWVQTIVPEMLAHAHKHVPVISRFVVAPDGHLLVSRRDLSWDQPDVALQPHDMLSPEGRFLGRIDMPANFRPYVLMDAAILGIWTDQLGVQYIVRYRVEGLPGDRPEA